VFIVDTQVHIWKEETPDRPWIPGARERMRLNGHREEAFTHQECIDLMDEAGVDRVLIVPPSWEGDRIDYAMEACEAYPGRFGIMARVPSRPIAWRPFSSATESPVTSWPPIITVTRRQQRQNEPSGTAEVK
jgi:hypothetical protein